MSFSPCVHMCCTSSDMGKSPVVDLGHVSLDIWEKVGLQVLPQPEFVLLLPVALKVFLGNNFLFSLFL